MMDLADKKDLVAPLGTQSHNVSRQFFCGSSSEQEQGLFEFFQGKNEIFAIPLKKARISDVKINSLFAVISDKFGYDAREWAKEIVALRKLWKENGFIEVYQTNEDRKFGLINDSSINNRGAISPYYIDLFHARLINDVNDPMIILKFHHIKDDQHYADMKFMLDHCDIFGDKSQEFDHAQMRFIWKQIDEFINKADSAM